MYQRAVSKELIQFFLQTQVRDKTDLPNDCCRAATALTKLLKSRVGGESAGEPEVVLHDDAVHALGRRTGPGHGATDHHVQDVLLAYGARERISPSPGGGGV